MSDGDLEQLGINVIRGLAMDAPQAAGSGHPGTAMALAPLAHVLWTRIMRHDPSDPHWPDRDRFILSCGHASILAYSMLHLTGYDLSLDDLRHFRQLHSRCPGHPEVGLVPGIEVTTGPLGQGFANGVGMGIAERLLRARFGAEVVDHHTFVLCSDGDLMEGISHEAASLAGHLGLGRLIYVYDDNHITIDGPTEIALDDDAGERFEAYGWHVERLGEVANDTDALEAALRRAMAVESRPSLLILRSHIGWPSPHKTDTSAAHGEPLGADEVRATKEILGLPPDETFWIPPDVAEFYRRAVPAGRAHRLAWEGRLEAWTGDRELWDATWQAGGVSGWADKLPTWHAGEKVATRRAINACLNAVVDLVPCPGRRRRRPDRQHRHQARRHGQPEHRAPRGPPDQLRSPRARHGGHHERSGPPRWCPPRRRHLFHLQRLHAGRGSPRRPQPGQGHLLLDARFGGPRRGRLDPPARRAAGVPPGHARVCGSSDRPTPTRPPTPSVSPWTGTARPR